MPNPDVIAPFQDIFNSANSIDQKLRRAAALLTSTPAHIPKLERYLKEAALQTGSLKSKELAEIASPFHRFLAYALTAQKNPTALEQAVIEAACKTYFLKRYTFLGILSLEGIFTKETFFCDTAIFIKKTPNEIQLVNAFWPTTPEALAAFSIKIEKPESMQACFAHFKEKAESGVITDKMSLDECANLFCAKDLLMQFETEVLPQLGNDKAENEGLIRQFLKDRTDTNTKTGYTGSPDSLANQFCVRLALSCIDKDALALNFNQTLWQMLMPNIIDVHGLDEGQAWPPYGATLLDDDLLAGAEGKIWSYPFLVGASQCTGIFASWQNKPLPVARQDEDTNIKSLFSLEPFQDKPSLETWQRVFVFHPKHNDFWLTQQATLSEKKPKVLGAHQTSNIFQPAPALSKKEVGRDDIPHDPKIYSRVRQGGMSRTVLRKHLLGEVVSATLTSTALPDLIRAAQEWVQAEKIETRDKALFNFVFEINDPDKKTQFLKPFLEQNLPFDNTLENYMLTMKLFQCVNEHERAQHMSTDLINHIPNLRLNLNGFRLLLSSIDDLAQKEAVMNALGEAGKALQALAHGTSYYGFSSLPDHQRHPLVASLDNATLKLFAKNFSAFIRIAKSLSQERRNVFIALFGVHELKRLVKDADNYLKILEILPETQQNVFIASFDEQEFMSLFPYPNASYSVPTLSKNIVTPLSETRMDLLSQVSRHVANKWRFAGTTLILTGAAFAAGYLLANAGLIAITMGTLTGAAFTGGLFAAAVLLIMLAVALAALYHAQVFSQKPDPLSVDSAISSPKVPHSSGVKIKSAPVVTPRADAVSVNPVNAPNAADASPHDGPRRPNIS